VRLESGEVASVPINDVNENRSTYTRALAARTNLPFDASDGVPRAVLRLAKTRIDETIDPSSTTPVLRDERFEEQLAGYLKETQEWELQDAPPAHERHFLRKKRRAAIFENRR